MIAKQKIPFYGFVFLIAVFVKQFYLLPSGSFQIADILFLLSYVIMAFSGVKKIVSAENKPLLIFVVLTGVVNGVYALIYSNSEILLSSAYIAFNLLVVLVFNHLTEYERFLKLFGQVLRLSLVSQFIIWISGSGTYVDGRYLGTFNDPNQYGFYILSTFFMLALLCMMRDKNMLVWACLAFILIMPCASVGMASGFIVFLIVYILCQENQSSLAKAVQLFLIIFAVFFIFMISKGMIHLPSVIENSFMYERITGKLDDAQSSIGDIIHDRNIDKVFKHLEYVLIGCGEGIYWRFGNANEVHSTVFGLLWYYGIVPCYFLISWIKSKIKGISKEFWCVYAALFAEALTLVNHRQPMFWMIIAIAGLNALKRKDDLREGNY